MLMKLGEMDWNLDFEKLVAGIGSESPRTSMYNFVL